MQFIFIQMDEDTVVSFACVCNFQRNAANSPWRHAFLEWEMAFVSSMKAFITNIVNCFTQNLSLAKNFRVAYASTATFFNFLQVETARHCFGFCPPGKHKQKCQHF